MLHGILRVALVGALGLAPVAAAGPAAVWLTAEDGVEIRGDLYALEDDAAREAPVILLFHQAGSNRGEYAEIAPRLQGMGFHVLAIDQRSGGERWGTANETVDKLGTSTKYLAALPDLQAALKWTEDAGYGGGTVVWGSSYSASLVFLLAAGNERVDGILSFSPGEYLGTRTDEVRKAAGSVSQPVLVLTPVDERDRAQPVVDVIPGEDKRFVVPDEAVHGSSMLVPGRNAGAEKIWPVVNEFLERFKN